MKWLAIILEAVLRALLPVLAEKSQPTAEDADRQTDLRDRLRARVRMTWGRRAAVLLIAAVIVLAAGCGMRTIYVPDGTPIRLRATIRGAKVWVLDADGKPVPGRMDLPEGWYCLPVPLALSPSNGSEAEGPVPDEE